MRIRRIRIVLPARLGNEALSTARLTGTEIASALRQGASPDGPLSARIAGGGQSPAMLARSAASALFTRRQS